MIEGEQLNSGVEEQVSQEPAQPVVDNSSQGQSAPDTSAAEKATPFHEHPRWKEMIAQRDQHAQELQEARRQLAEYNSKAQAAEKQRTQAEDPSRKLVERLKGIDPEFGTWAEQQEEARAQYKEMLEWRKNMESERIRTTAETTLNSLNTELKIPVELQGFYRAQAQSMALANPRLGVKDLPAIYKQIHSQMNGYLEAQRRADRESYVADKKVASQAPSSQPKGQPVGKAKESWPNDPDAARRKLVADVLKSSRTQKPENV